MEMGIGDGASAVKMSFDDDDVAGYDSGGSAGDGSRRRQGRADQRRKVKGGRRGKGNQIRVGGFGAQLTATRASDSFDVGITVTVTFSAFHWYQDGALVLHELPCGSVSSGAYNLFVTVSTQLLCESVRRIKESPIVL